MNVNTLISEYVAWTLPMRILRARERLLAPIRAIVVRSDLTETQWRVLWVLNEQGNLDATRLAEECNLLLPSQTRILQTLTERGLVLKQQDRLDRRRQELAITEAGRRIVEQNAAEFRALSARIESRLGPKRLRTLMSLLDDLDGI